MNSQKMIYFVNFWKLFYLKKKGQIFVVGPKRRHSRPTTANLPSLTHTQHTEEKLKKI